MTLFLHEQHELLHLVVNSIRKDLTDHNELFNCLALHAIANVGGREMGEALSGEVHRLLISPYGSWRFWSGSKQLTNPQDFESLCEKEGCPHPPQTLPKAPRYRTTTMGRKNYFPHGRRRYGCSSLCDLSSYGACAGPTRTIQRQLCEGSFKNETDISRWRIRAGLSLLQGAMSLDTSEALEIVAIFSTFWYVNLEDFNLATC